MFSKPIFIAIKARAKASMNLKGEVLILKFFLNRKTDSCTITATDSLGASAEQTQKISESSDMADMLFSRIRKKIKGTAEVNVVTWTLDFQNNTETSETFFINQEGNKQRLEVTNKF